MNSLHSGKRFCTLSAVWFIDMIISAMIIVNFKLRQAKSQDYLWGYHTFERL